MPTHSDICKWAHLDITRWEPVEHRWKFVLLWLTVIKCHKEVFYEDDGSPSDNNDTDDERVAPFEGESE